MFEKIVFNLLSNAFKAISENGKIAVVCNYHKFEFYFLLTPFKLIPFEELFEIVGLELKKKFR